MLKWIGCLFVGLCRILSCAGEDASFTLFFCSSDGYCDENPSAVKKEQSIYSTMIHCMLVHKLRLALILVMKYQFLLQRDKIGFTL